VISSDISELTRTRLNGLALTFEKADIRSDHLKMVNECKKLFDE